MKPVKFAVKMVAFANLVGCRVLDKMSSPGEEEAQRMVLEGRRQYIQRRVSEVTKQRRKEKREGLRAKLRAAEAAKELEETERARVVEKAARRKAGLPAIESGGGGGGASRGDLTVESIEDGEGEGEGQGGAAGELAVRPAGPARRNSLPGYEAPADEWQPPENAAGPTENYHDQIRNLQVW